MPLRGKVHNTGIERERLSATPRYTISGGDRNRSAGLTSISSMVGYGKIACCGCRVDGSPFSFAETLFFAIFAVVLGANLWRRPPLQGRCAGTRLRRPPLCTSDELSSTDPKSSLTRGEGPLDSPFKGRRMIHSIWETTMNPDTERLFWRARRTSPSRNAAKYDADGPSRNQPRAWLEGTATNEADVLVQRPRRRPYPGGLV